MAMHELSTLAGEESRAATAVKTCLLLEQVLLQWLSCKNSNTDVRYQMRCRKLRAGDQVGGMLVRTSGTIYGIRDW